MKLGKINNKLVFPQRQAWKFKKEAWEFRKHRHQFLSAAHCFFEGIIRGFEKQKVCRIFWRFDYSGIASAMIKPTDRFRCGKPFETHEIPGADILEIAAIRLSNRWWQCGLTM